MKALLRSTVSLMRFRTPVLLALLLVGALFELACNSPERDYRRTEAENTESAYKSFIGRHPQDPLAVQAATRLSRLAYDRTNKTGTEAAYAEFTAQYPKDPLVAQATARLEELSYARSQKMATRAGWTDFLNRFPRSEFAPKAQAALIGSDDDYKKQVTQWAKQRLFPGQSEERVYADVKRRHMHYLYVAFLELFPKTTRRAEVETLLSQFSAYTFSEKKTLTYKEMADTFSFNGNHFFYRWNGTLVVTMVGDSTYMMAPDSFYTPDTGMWGKQGNGPETSGSFCYGNLQIVKGIVTGRGAAKEFGKGTVLVFPSPRH